MKEAMLYDPVENNRVVCNLCRFYCKILPDRWGICGVRKNIDGKLYSFVYENAIAVHVDPIEKKPLFHVFPGSPSFSIATMGCNFHCKFCQNSDIAQINNPQDRLKEMEDIKIPGQYLSVEAAVKSAIDQKCKSIAYTYTEPTIFFEYAYAMCKMAVRHDIINVFVTNGYMSEEAVEIIFPYLHAANVDLKGFNSDFYRKQIGAKLDSVLDSLKLMKQKGIWLEVTTLVVPGYSDDKTELRKIARFISNELGPDTPWHISRFFPHHKMSDSTPTSLKIIQHAREIGLEEGLRYVYTGNIPGDSGEHTNCYQCKKQLIRRSGFQVIENKIQKNRCPYCDVKIDGLGMSG